VISERGLGKRLKVEQLRNQHRGGSGVKVAKITTKTGSIAAAATVSDAANDALIATASGQIIRISVAQVKILSRLASGVILIRLDKTDKVTSLMIAAKKENIEDAKE
ncbi:MAG: DNA gyrase C-terminal beta-propeller domain-containing protein, partial [Patescibacteria group bacterium]